MSDPGTVPCLTCGADAPCAFGRAGLPCPGADPHLCEPCGRLYLAATDALLAALAVGAPSFRLGTATCSVRGEPGDTFRSVVLRAVRAAAQ